MPDQLAFLSDAWFAEVSMLYAAYGGQPVPRAQRVRVNQIVTGAPVGGGTILAHIDTCGPGPSLGPGHVDAPDATITIDYQVAKAIFVEGNPQAPMRAFMMGELRVRGEITKLITAQQQFLSIVGPEFIRCVQEITGA